MTTAYFDVIQMIKVVVDESKFTEEFMEEFQRNFYPFYTIEDHMKHLAQLYSRGIVDEFSEFIEGYGNPKDFGIDFNNHYVEVVEVDGP